MENPFPDTVEEKKRKNNIIHTPGGRRFRSSPTGSVPEITSCSPFTMPPLKYEYDYTKEDVIEDVPMDVITKIAAAIVSPCVVGVSSRAISEEVVQGKDEVEAVENVFSSSGIIIECQDIGDGRHFSTIIASATLFKHDRLQPNQVKVHVFLSDKKYEGELLGCDFHYNLAAIRIQSDSPLQAAKLQGLDDILPIDPTRQLKLCEGKSFLRSHSNLFKILPGTKLICLGRSCTHGSRPLQVASGVCCTQTPSSLDCNELYRIDDLKMVCKQFDDGGPVCNCQGEVIGIMFYRSPFLPSNIIKRWWKHYKRYGEFRRPWLGMKVANFHSVRLEVLKQFLKVFPNFSAGVVVLKIAKDSPAYCSRIRPKDVIVKCDGKWVRSNLEFFKRIWGKVGKSVDFTVLRASDGSQFNVSLTIRETALDQFNRWDLPVSWPVKRRKIR